MNNRTPYFSFDGLCFQTPGDDLECRMNTAAAMGKIEAFTLTGAGEQDAMEALAFLEDKFTKLERCCDLMRLAFLPDDQISDDDRKRIARKGYNCLVDRLNGLPWAG